MMPSTLASARRYVPITGIGRGGMGRVDLAIAIGLPGAEQLVVLKRLHESQDQTDEARADLVREARLSARLMHPNVAATLGLDVLGGELVLVLEYLEGVTLSMIVRQLALAGVPVPRPIFLRIVREALAGLAYAHGVSDYDGTPLGIVHRDVSPSNLLVTTDGITKVLDFGIAKDARSSNITPRGYVKGKLGYMAPEQLLGRQLDARADIYAAGVILWEGLTGQRFSATNDLEACLAFRLAHDPADVRTVDPSVPAELAEVVRVCLARDPRARWSSAAMLRAVLDAHVAAHGADASSGDVARFVDRHFGDALRARRQYVQDRFASLTRPSTTTLRIPTAPLSASMAALVVDVRPGDGRSTPVRTTPARSAARSLVAFGALVVGAVLSFSTGELRARNASTSRAARSSEIVGAKRGESPERRRAVDTAPARMAEKTPAPLTTAADTAVPTGSVLPSEASGWATIDSYPWSVVTIDGVPAGVTPVVRLSLRPGRHVVALENPEHGRHELAIDVRDGDTVTERWRW